MGSHLGILFMKLLAPLPLSWVRALGWLLGRVLYLLIPSRRHVVGVNLAQCFPLLPQSERDALVSRIFVRVAQAWLDRSWLWHGEPEVVRRRLNLTGALAEFEGKDPIVMFAPHFVGMDAGWTAVTQQLPRRFTGIYTDQANKIVDAWMLKGRQRFEAATPFGRIDGVKAIVSSLRAGEPLYLLPDMNFGPEESIFVPFYGVPAATVPSLSRFARLGRAKVVPVVARMTARGYDIVVKPAWSDFPTADVEADTARMNRMLQEYIGEMPDQYYWVHKRFKSRPPGLPDLY
jgi:Kdo2-lipid IVA lauroyltransferase/acyltransferase